MAGLMPLKTPTCVSRLSLPTFVCKFHYQHHDCDCCGSFTNTDCTLTGPSTRFEFDSDGHFGGGTWDGNIAGVCKLILKRLGVSLVLQTEAELESGPQPVDLNELGIYDPDLSGYDGLVPLDVTPLPGLTTGLTAIWGYYTLAPTDEQCGEYAIFLNDDKAPFATFSSTKTPAQCANALHEVLEWTGREYDALEYVLKRLGCLVVKEKSTDHASYFGADCD